MASPPEVSIIIQAYTTFCSVATIEAFTHSHQHVHDSHMSPSVACPTHYRPVDPLLSVRVGSCSLKFDRRPQVHCGHHHQWLHCTMAQRVWDTASISTENIVDAPHKLGTTSTMQQDRVLTARGVTNCQILTPFDGGRHSSWHLKFDSSRTFQKLPGGAVRQLGKST